MSIKMISLVFSITAHFRRAYVTVCGFSATVIFKLSYSLIAYVKKLVSVQKYYRNVYAMLLNLW